MLDDQTLERIETKIAFLERANTELSDVLFSQQRLIDALRAQVATLEARIQAAEEAEAPSGTVVDERPPHY
jgi:SlyX protein